MQSVKQIVIFLLFFFLCFACKQQNALTTHKLDTGGQKSIESFEEFKLLDGKKITPVAFDRFVRHLIDSLKTPALSIAIINNQNLVFYHNYGYKSLKDSTPVDANSLFEAASITKPFFTYAFMQLKQANQIALDKPLYEYMPLADLAHDPRHKIITARMVLSHTTGLPNWREDKLAFEADPGVKHIYSGEGFEYLGKVVEKIKQDSLHRVLAELLIRPYQMHYSSFIENDNTVKHMTLGHRNAKVSQRNLSTEAHPAYGLMTNAQEFGTYLSKIYQTPLFREMCVKQIQIDSSQSIGLSVFSKPTKFGPKYYHTGNNSNRFTGRFEVYPGQKFGFVFFTNSNQEEVLSEAIWKYLGL